MNEFLDCRAHSVVLSLPLAFIFYCTFLGFSARIQISRQRKTCDGFPSIEFLAVMLVCYSPLAELTLKQAGLHPQTSRTRSWSHSLTLFTIVFLYSTRNQVNPSSNKATGFLSQSPWEHPSAYRRPLFLPASRRFPAVHFSSLSGF